MQRVSRPSRGGGLVGAYMLDSCDRRGVDLPPKAAPWAAERGRGLDALGLAHRKAAAWLPPKSVLPTAMATRSAAAAKAGMQLGMTPVQATNPAPTSWSRSWMMANAAAAKSVPTACAEPSV